MPWKKEYAENRKKRAAEDEEYRLKRNRQSCSDKDARKEYMKKYYKEKPEKFKQSADTREAKNAARRARYAEDAIHREKMKLESKKWQLENPDKVKHKRLMSAFGITLDQYNEMLAKQNHACAICGMTDQSNPKVFPHVDHCHATGKIRGILCSNCNMALGKFKDDTSLLYSAISYLQSRG